MDTGVRTLGRFAWWGVSHGPLWGVGAMLLARLLPEGRGRTGYAMWVDLLAGAGLGLVLGLLVGLLVGVACLLADHVPHWLLDAPDYVAVLVVVAVAALAQRELAGSPDVVLTLLAVVALALPAAFDAALMAPVLLHPTRDPALTTAHPASHLPTRWLRLLPHR